MACATGETSAILDCICVNGLTLLEHIAAEDLLISAEVAAALACCTTNTAAIAVLEACCVTVQADVTTLEADITALQALITILQGLVHVPVVATNNAAPFSFVSTTQTLNVPRGLHVVLQGIVTDPLPSFTVLLGSVVEFETVEANEGFAVGGMTTITVPYDGLYHISGSIFLTGPDITLVSGNDSARLSFYVQILGAGGNYRAELGNSYLPAGTHQFWGVEGATIRRLSAGDQLFMIAGQSSALPLPTRNVTYLGLPDGNFFEVTWLGD